MSDDEDPTVVTEAVELESIVDVDAVRALVGSWHALFGVDLRLYSGSGTLLAESTGGAEICEMLRETERGRSACRALLDEVQSKAKTANNGECVNCFTGARYDVLVVSHDARPVGRIVLGPYREAGAPLTLSDEVLAFDEALDRSRALRLLPDMPQLSAERAASLAEHLRMAIQALLKSGYAALVTSQLHVATMRESYRALRDKTSELEAAYGRQSELDGLKTSFLSTVSHELRTPLTSIIGYSDMLLEGMSGELNDDQRESLGVIRRQGEQLLSLIRNLLDMSQFEQGSMPIHRVDVDVLSVLRDVVEMVKPQAMAAGVAVDLVAADAATVRADPERLRQVFTNLVDNALKFSSSGDSVRIELNSVDDDHAGAEEMGYVLFAPLRRRIEIRVSDEGPGIPENERVRIFDAFYQIDHSHTRKHTGAGIGLSIVRYLVEAHGGSVTVEAGKTAGTVFVVRLPAHNRFDSESVPPGPIRGRA